MFRDILEIVKEFLGRVIGSRIFALAIIFTAMFGVLVAKLFDMQIVNGEHYLTWYQRQYL